MPNENYVSPREFMHFGSLSLVDVELFDPPMCCSTGLCGPTVDQSLLDLSEMILQLEKDGVHVQRYQMTTHPSAFLNNPEVMRLVREQQLAALPITVVRGKIIKVGEYPTLAEIQKNLAKIAKTRDIYR